MAKLYVAYGSNLNKEQMRYRCPTAKFVGTGIIEGYAKSRPVFEKYKASKYSRKFLAEHEADIELYRAACADFKRILDGGKLPKMDALKEEGRKLAEQKKKLYAEYRKAKADMQEVTTIKANIDYLLGYSEPGRKKEQER